jgi:hypothetical protein
MKLIDKDALVAEIKRLAEVGRNNASGFDEYRKEKAVWLQQVDVCNRILSFLNNLEVKEVDLDDNENGGDAGDDNTNSAGQGGNNNNPPSGELEG